MAYDGNFNDKEFYSGAAFDNISLRQEPCNTYTYDSEGNLTAVNAAGSDSSFTYSAGNRLTKSQTKANGTYTYKYENSNNNHLVTKITNDNVSMNITYDQYSVLVRLSNLNFALKLVKSFNFLLSGKFCINIKRGTDAVNDVLVKFIGAKKKKFKII